MDILNTGKDPNEIDIGDMSDYIQMDKEAYEILTDLVNGTYSLKDFRSDVIDYLYHKNLEKGKVPIWNRVSQPP